MQSFLNNQKSYPTTHHTMHQGISEDIHDMLPRLWGVNNWTRPDAPCNHPCSLMRSDLPKLRRREYVVGAKADGTRAFLLFSFVEDPDTDYVALVDRAYTSNRIQVIAPPDFHSGTLLDGELIVKPDGTSVYMVFDIIAMCGYPMRYKSHTERYSEVLRVVNTIGSTPEFSIKAKPWFEMGSAGYTDIAASIEPVPCDGLIFMPKHGHAIRTGRQVDHFKWKRAADHTIDFRVLDNALWVGEHGDSVAATLIGVESFTIPTELGEVGDNEIVEFALVRGDNNLWKATAVRKRPDKIHPNDIRVAKLTLQNIDENISIGELA